MLIILNRFKMQRDATLSSVRVVDEAGQVVEDFFGIEKPWRDNKPFESCVPSGFYTLLPFNSERFGSTWAMVGGTVSVRPGDAARYACLFHVANYGKNVEGCIGLGESEGVTEGGELAVWSSRQAMTKFYDLLDDGNIHFLQINWM